MIYSALTVTQEQVLFSLVPHRISRELSLPRIAVVRSRPPSIHSHRGVAVPRPSAPLADSRRELRRINLDKSREQKFPTNQRCRRARELDAGSARCYRPEILPVLAWSCSRWVWGNTTEREPRRRPHDDAMLEPGQSGSGARNRDPRIQQQIARLGSKSDTLHEALHLHA